MPTEQDGCDPKVADVGEGAAAHAAAPSVGLRAPRWKRRERFVGLLFLVPAVVYLLAFYAYPILLNFYMAVTSYTAKSFVTGEAPFVGLGNFSRLVNNPDFSTVIRNTVVFTLSSLLFQFTIGLAIAIFFQRRFPLSKVLRALILLPWLAPILVSGSIWVRLFDMDYGVVNFVLRTLHVTSQRLAWLTDPHLAPLSVLIANIWIGIPFNMVILYGGLEAIPTELYEAAEVDGANPWQRFRYISWPLLRSVSAVVLLLGLVYTLKVFDLIMSITRGGPANMSHTLNTYAYSLSFFTLDFGLGSAAGSILMVVVFVFGLLYLWYAYREVGEAME
jgi:multiple sugar transport system permease protein